MIQLAGAISVRLGGAYYMEKISSRKLWESQDEQVWKRCYEAYWNVRSVNDNHIIEEELNILAQHRQVLFKAGAKSWYEFLFHKYIPWKLKSQGMSYESHRRQFARRYYTCLTELDSIKTAIAHAHKTNVLACLEIATTIDGFGIPSGSGLLAVLYPEHFGTIDQLILRAFREIPHVNQEYQLDSRTHSNNEYFSGKKTDRARLRLAEELIDLFIQRAAENNNLFGTSMWTPRKVEMALWTTQHPDVWG